MSFRSSFTDSVKDHAIYAPTYDSHIIDGGLVFDEPLYQESNDLSYLINQAEHSRDLLRSILMTHANTVRAGDTYTNPAQAPLPEPADNPMDNLGERYDHLLAHGFVLAPNKSAERLQSKLKFEKSDTPSLIKDYVRGMLIIETPEQLKWARKTFSPGNNRNVLQYTDGFSQKDFAYRRMHILYRLPNDHIAEVQVVYKGALNALEESHEAYSELRELEQQRIMSPSDAGIEKRIDEVKAKRQQANQDAETCAEPLLSESEQDIEFFVSNGTPIAKKIGKDGRIKLFCVHIGDDLKLRWQEIKPGAMNHWQLIEAQKISRKEFYRRAGDIYKPSLLKPSQKIIFNGATSLHLV